MKDKDRVRTDTLRSVLSAFSYRRIEAGRELDEAEQVDAVRKQVKQRNDSIAEFRKGNRDDLVAKEVAERDILAALLPPQKSADDIRPAVRAVIDALPADGRNQGAVMKAVMPQFKGEADGALIREIVLEELARG
jgi:uncharacterized protein YqeY